MSKLEKLLEKLLRGTSDASFSFDDLRYILRRVGFEEHVKGSHHIFSRDGVEEQPNLQRYRASKDAKPYQVRQVREILTKHDLGGGTTDEQV